MFQYISGTEPRTAPFRFRLRRQWNNDFRSTYATLLEQWMGLDSKAILRGSFEQLDFIKG